MFSRGNFSDIEHHRDAYYGTNASWNPYGTEAGNYSLFDIIRAITIMFMSPIACIRKELRKFQFPFKECHDQWIGLLICTLISEKLGLEKSRSVSNLRKISGPASLDFFLGLHLERKLDLYHKPKKNPGDKLKKKSSCVGPENFLRP